MTETCRYWPCKCEAVHPNKPPESAEMQGLRAQVAAAEARAVQAEQALRRLVAKLDAIAADPSYLGMAALHAARGGRYTGPNWADELAIAKSVLEVAASGSQSEGVASPSVPLPDAATTRAKIADGIVQEVAELPDRDSPDGWPEAMLVTAEELRLIVMEHLEDALTDVPAGQAK